jgi:hypothetical protein
MRLLKIPFPRCGNRNVSAQSAEILAWRNPDFGKLQYRGAENERLCETLPKTPKSVIIITGWKLRGRCPVRNQCPRQRYKADLHSGRWPAHFLQKCRRRFRHSSPCSLSGITIHSSLTCRLLKGMGRQVSPSFSSFRSAGTFGGCRLG